MNTILIPLLTAALLLCSTDSTSADETRTDGNWWNAQNEYQKAGYIEGFWGGNSFERELVDAVVILNTPKTNKPGEVIAWLREGAKIEDALAKKDGALFSNVTVGQMLDGVNSFYSDFKNRRIHVTHAILVVGNEISGASQASINTMTNFYRQHDAN